MHTFSAVHHPGRKHWQLDCCLLLVNSTSLSDALLVGRLRSLGCQFWVSISISMCIILFAWCSRTVDQDRPNELYCTPQNKSVLLWVTGKMSTRQFLQSCTESASSISFCVLPKALNMAHEKCTSFAAHTERNINNHACRSAGVYMCLLSSSAQWCM